MERNISARTLFYLQKIWLHAFENICMASSRPCAVIVELHHLIDKIGENHS